MQFNADLHIHSRFSNATSKYLNINSIAKWGSIKGIGLIGSGDFTHPLWLSEIEEKLQYDELSHFYRLKSDEGYKIRFCLTSEVSLTYYDEGYKKIHLLILAPGINVVKKINKFLAEFGDLSSDGRPVLNISCEDLVEGILNISQDCEIIPAHIWTPWFGVMGKKFGYNRLEECFKSMYGNIHAIETGISSDPYMNWLALPGNISIVSFSDAHSLEKIGREATRFNCELVYEELIKSIRKDSILSTIEYFPEEGKYHYSGHRKCGISIDIDEDMKQINTICPLCKRKLTEGVFKRVIHIALQNKGEREIQEIKNNLKYSKSGFIGYKNKPQFIKLVSLSEIIAKNLGIKSTKAKKVISLYNEIIERFGNELDILINPSKAFNNAYPDIYDKIIRVHKNDLKITPGFDNMYGIISFD